MSLRFLTILLLNVIPEHMAAQTLKVAFGKGKPPYIFEEAGQVKGIEADVVREIMTRLNLKMKPVSLSFIRLEAEANHGNEFDVFVGVRNRDGGKYYSRSFISFKACAVTLKSRKIKLRKIADLAGRRVSVWRGAWKDLGADFQRVCGPRTSGSMSEDYQEYAFPRTRFMSLWNGETDVLIMDRHIFDWHRLNSSGDEVVRQDYEQQCIFHADLSNAVAFKGKGLRQRFDRELQEMKNSGELDRIIRSYVGERLAWMAGNGK